MDVVYYLIENFFKEEKIKIILLLLLSFTTNVFQINGISFITANIIQGIEHKNFNSVDTYFRYFVFISVFFVIFYNAYRIVQNDLLTKLRSWIRNELIKLVLLSNNEELDEINFTSLSSPINRISASSFLIFNSFITSLLPNISFLLMISIYFLYKNFLLGFLFFFTNLTILFYIFYKWQDMMEYKNDYEQHVNKNESYLIDMLTNLEKIIYRGESLNEIQIFSEKTKESIDKALKFYSYTNNRIFGLSLFIHTILFTSISYIIYLVKNKRIDTTTFVTFFTILILYRDRINSCVQQLPDYLDFIGRAGFVLNKFNNMVKGVSENENKYKYSSNLQFNSIKFENISFKFKTTEKQIFDKTNINVNTNNRTIGITGLSGNGKSTFAKMILKLYKADEGKIYIDGKDIEEIDSNYIRKNVTYVNQNSKLFDKKIIENILYGCNDIEKCNTHLKEIMQYPKIANLYKSIDFKNKQSGSLGESLSGGQRQVINIISGLVNPCKILILDEPTNALDPALKAEVLGVIKDFKKYKKCIMIITHDKDVYPLFDETIHI